jgi:hypothetical protein
MLTTTRRNRRTVPASRLLVAVVVAVPLLAAGTAWSAASVSSIIVNFKMSVNAKFERSIDNPDIREVRVAGTLQCKSTQTRPSSLTIKIGNRGQFVATSTRAVACKPLDPNTMRVGGSWSGDVVGKCNRTPAVAHVFVYDDRKGGGDVRLTLKA